MTYRRRSTAGDIDIIPKGVSAIWEEDGPTSQVSVGLSPFLVESAADAMGIDCDVTTIPIKLQLRDELIEHVCWALKAELESDMPYDRLYAEGLGLSLAVHLLRRHARRDLLTRNGLSRAQLRRVIQHINEHLTNNLTLGELAGVAGVSASHFKMLFKQRTGSPVHKYVMQQRVDYAVRQMLHGKSTLREVAQRAGFSDQSHMARCMRRLLGLTPTEVLRRSG